MDDRVMVPDGLPSLANGAHPEGGGLACIMELVSVIAGESWSDHPRCVHPLLAEAGIGVNDYLSDGHRDLIRPYIGRFFGTNDQGLTGPLRSYLRQWVPRSTCRGDSAMVKVSLCTYLKAEVYGCQCTDCYHPHAAVTWLTGMLDVVDRVRQVPPRLVTVEDVKRVREVVGA